MSLIIATGTNIGEREINLKKALKALSDKFELVQASRVYSSPAIEYLNQPDFLNQVLEFKLPQIDAAQTMSELLALELELGRERDIPKGPRVIDIDILFFGLEKNDSSHITLPHPRLFERSFVVKPLSELPYYQTLLKHYDFPKEFSNSATPIT